MDSREEFLAVLAKLIDPITFPFSSGARTFWFYLLGACVLAFFAWRLRTRDSDAGNRSGGFLAFLLPKSVFLHKSAVVDYKYYAVNRLLRVFGLIPILLAVPAVAGWTAAGLEALFGAAGAAGSAGPWTRLFYTLAVMVAFDFGAFAAHYLQHRVPILWEFHKVHHSAEVLTPITIYRFHPVDDSLGVACTAACVGVVAGIFQWAFSAPVNEVVALGFNLGLFLYFLLGYNLRHSHVWLAYPRWLAWFLISPAQHQIHHSADPKHFHRNFGFAFSFWDRMARTLYVPVDRESLEFGLGNGEDREYRSVTALYLVPFRKAARLFSGAKVEDNA